MVVFSSLTFATMLLAAALSASLPQQQRSQHRVNCEVNPSVKEGFTYVPFPNPVGSLGLIGDVNDVLNGIVTPETVNNFWNGCNRGLSYDLQCHVQFYEGKGFQDWKE
jgi:hypothetical protein